MSRSLGTEDFIAPEWDGAVYLTHDRANLVRRKWCSRIWQCDTVDDLDALLASDPDTLAAMRRDSHNEYLLLIAEFEEWRGFMAATSDAGPSPRVVNDWQTKGPTMANDDFRKIMIRDVEFLWPRLDQPYRYNQAEKRTEPCAPGAPNAAWSIAWKMPPSAAKAVYEECKAHYEACRGRNAKLPEFSTVFGWKKPAEKGGEHTFVAKKRAMNNAGDVNKAPKVVGPDLKDLAGDDLRIWSGSKGSVRVLAFPATDPQTGQGGITLLLDTVQIVEAVYGGDNLEDDFGPAKPVQKALPENDDDDFGAYPAAPEPARAAAKQPVPAGFDDDLGF